MTYNSAELFAKHIWLLFTSLEENVSSHSNNEFFTQKKTKKPNNKTTNMREEEKNHNSVHKIVFRQEHTYY